MGNLHMHYVSHIVVHQIYKRAYDLTVHFEKNRLALFWTGLFCWFIFCNYYFASFFIS